LIQLSSHFVFHCLRRFVLLFPLSALFQVKSHQQRKVTSARQSAPFTHARKQNGPSTLSRFSHSVFLSLLGAGAFRFGKERRSVLLRVFHSSASAESTRRAPCFPSFRSSFPSVVCASAISTSEGDGFERSEMCAHTRATGFCVQNLFKSVALLPCVPSFSFSPLARHRSISCVFPLLLVMRAAVRCFLRRGFLFVPLFLWTKCRAVEPQNRVRTRRECEARRDEKANKTGRKCDLLRLFSV